MKRRLLLRPLIVLLLSSAAMAMLSIAGDRACRAQSPTPVVVPAIDPIAGDTQIEPGELGILTLNVPTKGPDAGGEIRAVWAVWPELRLLVVDGGRQVAFATRKSGVYCFDVATDGPCLYRHVVTVKEAGPPPEPGPQPTPAPTPGPNPDPPKPPIPAAQKLWIITIWESGDATPQQARVIQSSQVKQLCEAKGHRRRVADRDNAEADLAPWIRRASSVAGGKLPVLFLAGVDGRVLWQGPLPATETAMLELVTKYGGK